MKSLKQIQAEVMQKLFIKTEDENGCIVMKRNANSRLSLEETAIALAIIEGLKKPFSRMCMCKYEKEIMRKLREGLSRYGYTKLTDILFISDRQMTSSYVPRDLSCS